jgi:hypothetical protein
MRRVCTAFDIPDCRGSEHRLVYGGVQQLHLPCSMPLPIRVSVVANAAEAVYDKWPKADAHCQHAPPAPYLVLYSFALPLNYFVTHTVSLSA